MQASQLVPDHNEAVVLIVDDDASIRKALTNLFQSAGLKVKDFASAAEILKADRPEGPSCLVLDVRLPGLSGLELQSGLASANMHTPIVFITGHADVPMTVQAMKGGAVDFLTKPFRDRDLLRAVQIAIERDRQRRELEKMRAGVRSRFEGLTQRERDILTLVASGLLNKQVAGELGLAEITVKVHRGQAMRKVGAKSLADLIRMIELLGLSRSNGNVQT
ncbi:DNA-binding response regulator (plasmid) [Bradyrhizobium sp. CCBAU 53351]|uniref:DNA-binding response regulator n=2 Tax=Bradyrhizobium TaxID=374 RepID=A0AAE5X9J4_9BRAD|nr:response regulator [Bradyrhizobium zhengyangense]QAU43831.1 DNA-binding response regulator [Bradyrhizobium guangdongense]QAU51232.1 DNA-binding response regulator [Bradyrhizobium guangzhouense]QOZ49880.1 DNA-binding response regulator [Bradyrhizobium sp. CCBAU 53340]QOZ57244.1 DNA-binding response regulator [Bradyrhizobium sp. CCBAU 53338]QOZ81572.1 DNA-binding response regulator [Bradyrhizobium sp. CCBAU 53351]